MFPTKVPGVDSRWGGVSSVGRSGSCCERGIVLTIAQSAELCCSLVSHRREAGPLPPPPYVPERFPDSSVPACADRDYRGAAERGWPQPATPRSRGCSYVPSRCASSSFGGEGSADAVGGLFVHAGGSCRWVGGTLVVAWPSGGSRTAPTSAQGHPRRDALFPSSRERRRGAPSS